MAKIKTSEIRFFKKFYDKENKIKYVIEPIISS
jgi:hypothetical protein